MAKSDLSSADVSALMYRAGISGLTRYANEAEGIVKKLAEAEQRYLTANDEMGKKLAEQELQRIRKLHKTKIDLINTEVEHYESKMKEWADEQKKSVGDIAESLGDGLENAWSSLGSGTSLQNASKAAKMIGAKVGTQAALMASKAAENGQSTKLAENLMRFSKILIGVGGIALAFAAVVKVMGEADTRMKEMNRNLLAGGAAGDMTAKGMRNVGSALAEIRNEVMSANFFENFRMTNDELIETLAALNTAGLTYDQMRDKAGGYIGVAQKANVLALNYGKTSIEMAADIVKMSESTTTSFENVTNQLFGMYDAAMQSGFGVQRFYGMIEQATTGMESYNVTLAGSVKVLNLLSKTMTARRAGEFLQSLNKGFRDDSLQDRLRRTIVTGTGRTQRMVRADAERTVSGFLEGLTPEQQAKLSGLMGSGAGSAKDFINQTRNMGDKDRNVLMAKAADAFGDPKMFEAFQKAMQTSRGVGRGAAGSAMALENMGPAGTLAMKLMQTRQVLGVDLDQLNDPRNAIKAMAAESSLGISTQERNDLGSIMSVLKGRYEMAGGMVGGQKVSLEEFIAKAAAPEEIKKLNEVFKDAEQRAREQAAELARNTKDSTGYMKGILDLLSQKIAPAFENVLVPAMEGIYSFLHRKLGIGPSLEVRQAQKETIADLENQSKTSGLGFFGLPDSATENLIKKVKAYEGESTDVLGSLATTKLLDKSHNEIVEGPGGTSRIVNTGAMVPLLSDEEAIAALSDADEEIVKKQTADLLRGNDSLAKKLEDITKKTAFDAEVARLVLGGETHDSALKRVSEAYTRPPVNDFIYRNDGSITPISSMDQLSRMSDGSIVGSRPGYPVQRSLGGGRTINVQMNITGTNEREITSGVLRAFDALERL